MSIKKGVGVHRFGVASLSLALLVGQQVIDETKNTDAFASGMIIEVMNL